MSLIDANRDTDVQSGEGMSVQVSIETSDYTTVESWSVSELLDALMEAPQGEKKISVPQFQRRLVWTKEKKYSFIDSIKLGYPVGALLLYSNGIDGAYNRFSLVDGLQRSATLKDYDARKFDYFKDADIPESVVQAILRISDETSADIIRTIILQWFRSRRGFAEVDDYSAFDLFSHIRQELDLEAAATDDLMPALKRFLQAKRSEADLSQKKLPVIIFHGARSKLPEIFNRINSKGTPLNKYEIYAATWIDTKLKTNDQNVLNAVVDKYAEIAEEADLEVEGFDAAEFRAPADISLFEFLFGLGKVLKTRYPLLFSSKSENPGETDSIAFTLATVALGLRLSDMDQLSERIITADLGAFVERLTASVDVVNTALKGIFDVKAQNLSPRGNYHTELQIASMIGYAYRRMFIPQGVLPTEWAVKTGINSNWSSEKPSLQRSLKEHYLYDILRGAWRGSGDSRLAANVFEIDDYSSGIPAPLWRGAFGEWLAEQLKSRLNERRALPADLQLFIKYIYASQISVLSNADDEYELEHLIPVKRLKATIAEDRLGGLPMNAIGNMALLPKAINRAKGDRTLTEYFDEKVASGAMSPNEADSKLQKYLGFAFVNSASSLRIPKRADQSDAPTEAWYRAFIEQRSEQLFSSFLQSHMQPA